MPCSIDVAVGQQSRSRLLKAGDGQRLPVAGHIDCGTSPVQLQPNVSEPNGTITITQVSECYVSITDMVGSSVMSRTKTSGSFKAPNASGTYFVTIETGVSTFRRTLIVY